jgi:DsbC/DsbD-like thiol-disulfide interchange protein/cytochrome c biogenesis protein CcdA
MAGERQRYNCAAPEWRNLRALVVALIALICVAFASPPAQANNIRASLVAEGPARPGETVMLAVLMEPEAGWHGYWKNPGNAGFGLTLDWTLPTGANVGELQFPVPQTLLLSGLMNHVYEHDYAVLVPLTLPKDASGIVPLKVKADWLACTDKICVPERAELEGAVTIGSGAKDPRFAAWRAALPAPLGQPARFAVEGRTLRIAIPFPASAPVSDSHFFIVETGQLDYAAPQRFLRQGDLLVAELQRDPAAGKVPSISGVLAIGGDARGLEISANPGAVPAGGDPVGGSALDAASLALLLGAALLGGLVLNVMPCVFPILSLKALTLARSGHSGAAARAEGLAYTAGVVLACLALGGAMLALRAAGEQVGWAFQLQEPGVVAALVLLAGAITANFAGLYELPGLSLERGSGSTGAFATGLLAAFVATPCTGPFMAAAMGAALVLPTAAALGVFAALGLGLALPFLLLGFVPTLRRALPKPGPWMETFRRWMALPMALTTLALLWLASRLGGTTFAALALAAMLALLALLWLAGRAQRTGHHAGRWALPLSLVLGLAAIAALPRFAVTGAVADAGLLDAQPFSEGALAEARKSGKPVFVYFTADWCLSCKVNEGVAIETEATKAAFAKAGVVTLRGDWTRRDDAITRFLSAQGVAGVPLYLWYPASGSAPQQLPQVLGPETLAGLAGK